MSAPREEPVCDDCNLPLSVCSARVWIREAVKRNGVECLSAIYADLAPVQHATRVTDEINRLRYVLEGVRGAIKTGRTEPLMVWLDQINIALDDTSPAQDSALAQEKK